MKDARQTHIDLNDALRIEIKAFDRLRNLSQVLDVLLLHSTHRECRHRHVIPGLALKHGFSIVGPTLIGSHDLCTCKLQTIAKARRRGAHRKSDFEVLLKRTLSKRQRCLVVGHILRNIGKKSAHGQRLQ